jgi:hypothetical protein
MHTDAWVVVAGSCRLDTCDIPTIGSNYSNQHRALLAHHEDQGADFRNLDLGWTWVESLRSYKTCNNRATW